VLRVVGKTGVTDDRGKIEFRLFNSSSILNIKKTLKNGRKISSFRGATAKLGAGVDNKLGGLAPYQCR